MVAATFQALFIQKFIMEKSLTLQITSPAGIDDDSVIAQIPNSVRKKLGEEEGSGFNLITNKRDIFFSKGAIQYQAGSTDLEVVFG